MKQVVEIIILFMGSLFFSTLIAELINWDSRSQTKIFLEKRVPKGNRAPRNLLFGGGGDPTTTTPQQRPHDKDYHDKDDQNKNEHNKTTTTKNDNKKEDNSKDDHKKDDHN